MTFLRPRSSAVATAIALACGAAAGCAGSPETAGGSAQPCTGCMLQSGCQVFADADITEASGLAASAIHPDVFYLHNDAGDSARFFATSCAGDDLGTYALFGAGVDDWEDMARGPCDNGSCLFIADIGDNSQSRTEYVVYRVTEPASLSQGTHQLASYKLPFAYPDGSHDAETLLVHPVTGEVAVITKVSDTGKSGVYVFPMPLSPGQKVTLAKAGEIAPPAGSMRFTGGGVHPKGEGILLRTYTHLFFYALVDGQSFAQALAAVPCAMPVVLEPQGEAVSFTAAGDGYVTVSENAGQSLHFASCQ